MKRFLVHIVLKDLSPETASGGTAGVFKDLDEAMKRFGFKKIIAEADGKQSELPRGIYVREERVELDRIFFDAEAAAAQVWSQRSTVVTEVVGYRCFGVRELAPES